MIILEGIIYKEHKFYYAEVFDLDLIVQSKTKREVINDMIGQIKSIVNKPDLICKLLIYKNEFWIETNDPSIIKLRNKIIKDIILC